MYKVVKEELKVRLVERIANTSDVVLRKYNNADTVYDLTVNIRAAANALQYLMSDAAEHLSEDAIAYMRETLDVMRGDKEAEISYIMRNYGGELLITKHKVAHNELRYIKAALSELDNISNLL